MRGLGARAAAVASALAVDRTTKRQRGHLRRRRIDGRLENRHRRLQQLEQPQQQRDGLLQTQVQSIERPHIGFGQSTGDVMT